MKHRKNLAQLASIWKSELSIVWLLWGSKRGVNSYYYIRSLGDNIYQVLPQSLEFFLIQVISKPVRWILLCPEEPVNLKGANTVWKILISPSIFVILISLFYLLILHLIQLYNTVISHLLDFIPEIEERACIMVFNTLDCNCVLCTVWLKCIFYGLICHLAISLVKGM